jgi:deoxyadenosine/deoxycytidine kinase
MFFKDIFSKIKKLNFISVGGPFGIGKSTIVKALSDKLNVDSIMELEEDDEFTSAILQAMYSKTDTYIPNTGNE